MATRNDGFILGKHLGKGLTKDETRKKIDIAVDGATIDFTDDGKLKSLASGGLDFTAIDRLPEVGWKKDTVVLAKQDGQYVRLKSAGDIFTDVVLELGTSKYETSITVIRGSERTLLLHARIQNAGTNPATDIRVILTKPLLGNYTFQEPQLSSHGATNFVKVSETEYTIESLVSGGTALIRIPVTFTGGGTYTFGGQVTSTIDSNPRNNTKSLSISVVEQATETGGNYVPTQDCPLFTITDLEYNKQLITFSEDTSNSLYLGFKTGTLKYNIYGDKRSLANRRFRLTNAEQIVCVSSSADNHSGTINSTSYKSSSYEGMYSYYSSSEGNIISYSTAPSYSSSSIDFTTNLAVHRDFNLNFSPSLYSGSNQLILPTSAYTFNKQTGELVFNSSFTYNFKSVATTSNVGALVIYVKPKGTNCKWQCCVIKFTANFTEKHPSNEMITHSSTLGDNVTFEYANVDSSSWYIVPIFDRYANWVNEDLPEGLTAFKSKSVSDGIKYHADTHDSVVVNIKKGISGTFTLTARDDRLAKIQTQGNIQTSYNSGSKTLTVTLNNPQPQNSMRTGKVEFRVID